MNSKVTSRQTQHPKTTLVEKPGTPFTHLRIAEDTVQREIMCRKHDPDNFQEVSVPGITLESVSPKVCPLCLLAKQCWPMVFNSLEQYYNERTDRRPSPEADYGANWPDPSSLRPQYAQGFKVSYLQTNGEMYAARLGQPTTSLLIVLGTHPPDHPFPHPGVYYKSLDQVLGGWPQQARSPAGLQWLHDKLKSR